MRVNRFGLFTCVKTGSQDWLFLVPSGKSDPREGLPTE